MNHGINAMQIILGKIKPRMNRHKATSEVRGELNDHDHTRSKIVRGKYIWITMN